MKKRVAVIIIVFTALLAGCTTPSATMKSWVGHDEAELLASWGAPDTMMNLDDGRKIYTWVRIRGTEHSLHQGRQTFTIDTKGKVASWSHENMPLLLRKR